MVYIKSNNVELDSSSPIFNQASIFNDQSKSQEKPLIIRSSINDKVIMNNAENDSFVMFNNFVVTSLITE